MRAVMVVTLMLAGSASAGAQQPLTPEAVELLKRVTSERYVKCIRDQIGALDDQVSDAMTIATAAYSACQKQRIDFYASDPAISDPAQQQRTALMFKPYEMEQATRVVLEGRAARRR